MTADQLHTLRHMLGINKPYDREPKPYRNYAAVNPGDPEYLELERLGAIEKVSGPSEWSEYDYYRCTEAGRAAAIASHRTIRKSRGARVYSCFLSMRDCDPDLTFRDFLTDPYYADVRRAA